MRNSWFKTQWSHWACRHTLLYSIYEHVNECHCLSVISSCQLSIIIKFLHKLFQAVVKDATLHFLTEKRIHVRHNMH